MYGFDPRLAFTALPINGQPTLGIGYGYNNLGAAPAWSTQSIGYGAVPSYPGYQPMNILPTTGVNAIEIAQLNARIEELRTQVLLLNETLRTEVLRRTQTEMAHLHPVQRPLMTQPFAQSFVQQPIAFGAGFGGGFQQESLPIRLRENDTHLFCEILLPQLTIGDVEVDVIGNRIVCRTRVPVMGGIGRWLSQFAQAPRGFEVFELNDGRVEFCWLAPVPFQAKEIEASFRDGFLCVCVPKAEATAARHSVKVVKETTGRRAAANEMNS